MNQDTVQCQVCRIHTNDEHDMNKSENMPLIAIVGETASGKSKAGIELSKIIKGEVICADSRTIYKYMDIGTAKPSEKEMDGVPHHLVSLVNPDKRFSAASFQELTHKCIQNIHSRNKMPIMVGGTGLYIDSVLYNYEFQPRPSFGYREELSQMSTRRLIDILNTKEIDAALLNTKNRRHLIRAIETNGRVSKNKKIRKNSIVLGLRLSREDLDYKIQKRVDQMFDDGFIEEVSWLANRYGWHQESMTGIGYKVMKSHLEGSASLEEVKAAFIQRDKSLAKRQRTWFKRNDEIKWFGSVESLVNSAVEIINSLDYNGNNVY